MPQIFHIATAADWADAQRDGVYATSTRGRTLAQEGYIHAAQRDQVQGVFRRWYADAGEPLVLLTIETERLEAEVREEAPDPGRPSLRFPHVYGPIPVGAVSDVIPLRADGRFPSVLELWLGESVRRMALAIGVMACSGIGYVVTSRQGGGALGAFVGLAVGVVIAALLVRSRRRPRRT